MAHLVFQTAFPGDLFLSIPLLKRIKEWEPQTPLVLACRPGLGEMFLKLGLVDEVIEVDKRTAQGRRDSHSRLKARAWDYIFVPHESPRTAGWVWRLRAKRGKVGFKRWWNFAIFNRRVERPLELPDALRQLSLLTPLDQVTAERFADPRTRMLASPTSSHSPFDFRDIPIPQWASMQIKPRASKNGRRVFLAPGSVWPTKRWTVEGFTELARQLQAEGITVELIGSPQEKALCDEIEAQVAGVRSHAGKTSLFQLVELFTQVGALALVCNDSGAMHAASVVGLPTIALFGPTVLQLGYRPWQNQAMVVQRDLPCRPCGKHGAKVCPIGTHACMKEIDASVVLQALRALVG